MKNKYLIGTLAFLLCTGHILAQDLQLRGRVVSGNNPVEYASVILQTPDSAYVTGGTTDSRGRFQMDNLKKGNYRLCLSSIGYEAKHVELNNLDKDTDMGTIEVDTTTFALNEVVVTASQVINRSDRKIVLPTALQVKASSNGLSLLQQLQLSRISVDPLRQTVSVGGGGAVQLRINGVEVSIQEVNSLRPEDILRIEYHDDPGLRYNGAEAVIDIITRHKSSGGHIALNLQDSPHVWFGNNDFTVKFNHKKSEFTAFYGGSYRGINQMWRENSETFNFEDGTSLTRMENGTPDKWHFYWQYAHLNYSYQEPDKYFFNATLRNSFNGTWRRNFTSYLYPVDRPTEGVNMKDHYSDAYNRPSLDLYYQQSFKNKQTLILNVVTTYASSTSDREYTEKDEQETLTHILSDVDGNKYSLIAEGIYEKEMGNGKLSTGIKHIQSYANNEYSGSSEAITQMRQADTYFYTEYQGKIKKFNYATGIGVTRSWFRQGEEGYQDYTLRPTLRMTYNFSENAFIRYRGTFYSAAPALSDMGETEQIIDSLQIRRGNPKLRPVMRYDNTLTFNIRKGIFSTNLFAGYWYQHRPIMDDILRENGKFVRTPDNQKSWQAANTELELKIGPVAKIFTASFTTGIKYFDSKGKAYRHQYTNWYYRGEAMANYRNWTMSFQMQSHHNNLWGETLVYGENFHFLGVSYRHKDLNFGLTALNPFVNNWKQGSENRSAYTPSKNWEYIKETSRLFALTLSYNLSFGRKYESGSKRLDNQDTDSGILSGSKK